MPSENSRINPAWGEWRKQFSGADQGRPQNVGSGLAEVSDLLSRQRIEPAAVQSNIDALDFSSEYGHQEYPRAPASARNDTALKTGRVYELQAAPRQEGSGEVSYPVLPPIKTPRSLSRPLPNTAKKRQQTRPSDLYRAEVTPSHRSKISNLFRDAAEQLTSPCPQIGLLSKRGDNSQRTTPNTKRLRRSFLLTTTDNDRITTDIPERQPARTLSTTSGSGVRLPDGDCDLVALEGEREHHSEGREKKMLDDLVGSSLSSSQSETQSATLPPAFANPEYFDGESRSGQGISLSLAGAPGENPSPGQRNAYVNAWLQNVGMRTSFPIKKAHVVCSQSASRLGSHSPEPYHKHVNLYPNYTQSASSPQIDLRKMREKRIASNKENIPPGGEPMSRFSETSSSRCQSPELQEIDPEISPWRAHMSNYLRVSGSARSNLLPYTSAQLRDTTALQCLGSHSPTRQEIRSRKLARGECKWKVQGDFQIYEDKEPGAGLGPYVELYRKGKGANEERFLSYYDEDILHATTRRA